MLKTGRSETLSGKVGEFKGTGKSQGKLAISKQESGNFPKYTFSRRGVYMKEKKSKCKSDSNVRESDNLGTREKQK